MEKRVKITVTGRPIVSASVPLIVGTHGPLVMDSNDIFKCVLAGAKVVELTKYGEVVLDLSNYDKENVPVTAAPIKEEIKSTPVVPVEPVKELEPVAPVTEEVVEEKAEEPAEDKQKSPDHWTPPQRTNNQNNNQGGKNSNNNNKK